MQAALQLGAKAEIRQVHVRHALLLPTLLQIFYLMEVTSLMVVVKRKELLRKAKARAKAEAAGVSQQVDRGVTAQLTGAGDGSIKKQQ